MKYIRQIGVLALVLILITGYIFYPKTIYSIIGTSINTENGRTSMKIVHKDSILDEGVYWSTSNGDMINKFLNEMNKYKFRIKLFSDYKKLDDSEFYAISVMNSDGVLIRFTIFDNKNILLENKVGYYGLYEIVGNEIDMKYITDIITN